MISFCHERERVDRGNLMKMGLGNILRVGLGNIMEMGLGNILRVGLGNIMEMGLGNIKEDMGIEQQLYEIVRGKNFALNCLS